MWFMSSAFNTVLSTAWKPVRGFYEGASGGAKIVKNGDKKATKVNPARALTRRLRHDAQQVLTGNKYDFKTGKRIDDAIRDKDGKITGHKQSFVGKHIGNRAAGAISFMGNSTLGALGTGLGWATRPIVTTATAIAPHAARAAGHMTYQSASFLGSTAVGGAKGIAAMSQNRVGGTILFGGATVGIGASGVGSHLINTPGAGSPDKLGFYRGQSVDSLPGTLASQGHGRSQVGADLGADGDLVLAMHNLR